MVPSVRRAALTTTTIALLPSFLDIVSTLLSPFPGLASQRLCTSVPTIGLCLGDCYIRPPTITPPSSRLEKRRAETRREKEKERVCVRTHVCACSITVTRPRRSSFSSDEHKSPVMTDRCRSDPSSTTAMPATARKCQGVGEALRKNSSPRTEVFLYTRISASKAFCRCRRGDFTTIDVPAILESLYSVTRTCA